LRVASIHKSIGVLEHARAHARRAIALLEELVAASPRAAEYRSELAEGHTLLAEILPIPHGFPGRRRALAILQGLAVEFPGDPAYRRRVAGLQCNLGLALSSDGATEFAEAEQHLRAALATWDQADADFPGLPGDTMELARLHHWMGHLLAQTAREPEAEAEYRRSLALLEGMAADAPPGPDLIERRAHVKAYLAQLRLSRGDREDWERFMREVVAAIEPIWQVFPDSRDYTRRLGSAYHGLGCGFWEQGRLAEAEEMLCKAVAVAETAVARQPGSAVHAGGLARKLRALGTFLYETGRTREASPVFRRLIALQEQLTIQDPDSGYHQSELAWWLSICPVDQLRDPARAVDHADRGVRLDSGNAGRWRVLGVARYRRGDWPTASEALHRALELDPGDRPAALFLAMIHSRQGHEAQARSWLEKGLQSPDPWFPSSRLDLIIASEARALIEQARSRQD
jgi:tetratricopeptide (TPR) repeat protein